MIRPGIVLVAIAVALAIGRAPVAPGADTAPRTSLPDIEDEVMCPICGTTLELSEAPQAERERALIRRLIARGADKQEVKDALVAEYGEQVLAVPSDEGFALAAWIVPPAALLLVGTALGLGLRSRRRRAPQEGAPVEPLDPDDADRLNRDLATDE